MKPFSGSTKSSIPDGGHRSRRIAFVLSVLVLFSILLFAFHRHDDGQDHGDDCPVCAVAHHRAADIAITLSDVTHVPFTSPAYSIVLVIICAVAYFCRSTQSRAPPGTVLSPPALSRADAEYRRVV
ncbi:hypothetical protein [Geobacter sp. AOG2]|uniref:hypothetical protein n=1 Tax=Geobacter sp. AOG2 TaxID=1566347 RepID=UPI001CC367E3|nr:hypothetical protein [Geobacter sp. AOG2]GFE62639.1 hypothetical protein AOG2_32270 [Geobacter sp. AOG2]